MRDYFSKLSGGGRERFFFVWRFDATHQKRSVSFGCVAIFYTCSWGLTRGSGRKLTAAEEEYARHLALAQNKANVDALTGVKNRYAFLNAREELDRQIAACRKSRDMGQETEGTLQNGIKKLMADSRMYANKSERYCSLRSQ